MTSFGDTLKKAREAKGLSLSELAEKTHIMSSILDELEREDFSHIVAPIYGRGFVKLYCETVGLDPKPLVHEFTEIYSGNRDDVIRERPLPPPEEASEPEDDPVEPDEAAPLADEPPAAPDDFFAPLGETTPREAIPAETMPRESAQEPSLFRYATPLRERAAKIPTLAIGRWAIVFILLALVLGGLVLGVRALYRATRAETPRTEAAAAPVESPRPAATAPAAPREPQEIPPLYID